VTKPRHQPSPEALETVRAIVRRAGHEIRNALNGVAVNVEVVRSRVGRQGVTKEDLSSFAERASSQIAEASALNDGLLALIGAALAAQVKGTLKSGTGHGAGSRIELMIYGDGAAAVVSDIERLASRIEAVVEQHGQRVILTVLPEGESHSKE
jgi:hypothetical protein